MKVLMTMRISMFIKKMKKEREVNSDWLYMNRKRREKMFNLLFSLFLCWWEFASLSNT